LNNSRSRRKKKKSEQKVEKKVQQGPKFNQIKYFNKYHVYGTEVIN